MGVFADLPRDMIAAALVGWGRGLMVACTPTDLGIENSNFFISTEDASGANEEWVLTVMPAPPSRAALALLQRLATAGLPVPAPVQDLSGRTVGHVDKHPALLAPRLPGAHPQAPSVEQCRAVGQFLARMHCIAEDLDGPEHPRDTAWLEAGLVSFAQRLDYFSRARLETAIGAISSAERQPGFARLPTGLVHGDLFRDNALFVDDRLTGVIDFHHAARAPLAFDLAVVAMDWCTDPEGRLDPARTRAMLEAYAHIRPLTREELWFWPLLLVQACARFLVARLHLPRKSPAEMTARLGDRLDRPMFLQPEGLLALS